MKRAAVPQHLVEMGDARVVYQEETGQLTFSSISTNVTNKVVQSNSMILGRQDLTLNEAKLVRIAIMQIVANDMEFKPYIISPGEFALMIGNTDPVNVYHRAKDICDSLMKKQLQIMTEEDVWKKINWVSFCEYNGRKKQIQIKLNEDLKPYLLGLVEKGFYTQYEGNNALSMSSVYALRLYELIEEAIKTKVMPRGGTHVRIDKATIVDACMLYVRDEKTGSIIIDAETKLPVERYTLSQLKEKVIKKGCMEINEKTDYTVPYRSDDKTKCVRSVRRGREVVAFDFYVNTKHNERAALPSSDRYIRVMAS